MMLGPVVTAVTSAPMAVEMRRVPSDLGLRRAFQQENSGMPPIRAAAAGMSPSDTPEGHVLRIV